MTRDQQADRCRTTCPTGDDGGEECSPRCRVTAFARSLRRVLSVVGRDTTTQKPRPVPGSGFGLSRSNALVGYRQLIRCSRPIRRVGCCWFPRIWAPWPSEVCAYAACLRRHPLAKSPTHGTGQRVPPQMLETATRPLRYDVPVQTPKDLTSERREIAGRCAIRVDRHVDAASMEDDHVNRSTRTRGFSDRELGTRPETRRMREGRDRDAVWPRVDRRQRVRAERYLSSSSIRPCRKARSTSLSQSISASRYAATASS